MKQLNINGIQIEVSKKKIKNMYLRVLPPAGRVSITAPIRMSEDAIYKFILSKKDWIIRQQDKMQRLQLPVSLAYVSGEYIPLWGKRYYLEVVPSKSKNQLSIKGDSLIFHAKETSTTEQRAKIINKWYRDWLEQEIPYLLEKWERIIRVKANIWTIRDMKTRWGSCNVRDKKICLNLQLAKKSPICLEYVVVHELVHLLEKSHNSVFKGYMDQFLPEWREIKKEMNGAEIDKKER